MIYPLVECYKQPIPVDSYKNNRLTGSFIVKIELQIIQLVWDVQMFQREKQINQKREYFDIWNEKKRDRNITRNFEERDISMVQMGKNVVMTKMEKGKRFFKTQFWVYKKLNSKQIMELPMTFQNPSRKYEILYRLRKIVMLY